MAQCLLIPAAVVSVRHQVLAELFHSRGELAPALLARCTDTFLAHSRVVPRSTDLSQIVSTEYRADAVLELRSRRDALLSAIVVEIQLRKDLEKRMSWPLYVSALRAQLACPVTLLVLTPSRAMARWARTPIELGHPGFVLTPLAIELAQVPRILDPADAAKLPELAVLSRLAHPEISVVETAIRALERLSNDQKQLYLDFIMAELPDAVRRLLEVRMEGYVYRSPFARKYFGAGHKKGLSKGRDVGRGEGLRTAVQTLAQAKLEALTARDAAAIASLRDEDAMTRLILALSDAQTARQVRAALKSAARRK